MAEVSADADLAVIGLRLPRESGGGATDPDEVDASLSGSFSPTDSDTHGLPTGRVPPLADEAAYELLDHYNRLLAGLPTTVLVHSSLDFQGSPVLFDE
ncbi:MAG: hypothetical protein R3F43_15730 [bacterium]